MLNILDYLIMNFGKYILYNNKKYIQILKFTLQIYLIKI